MIVGNILVVKLSDGNVMTCHRYDNDYSGGQPAVDAMVTDAHPSLTSSGHAICSAALLTQHNDSAPGANLDADINVMLKSAVTTEVIIPPVGVEASDIPLTDSVVVTTNPGV